MNNMTSIMTMALVISTLGALSVAGTLGAVERDKLPLGHPDFYPSPERPVGWRGDGNGAFPGATLVDRFGSGVYQETKKKIWADDSGEVNIAWKHKLPGWTHSQPIIVGDRVIQTCEPRTILCLDLKTGAEIWRQELCPFRLLGLEGEKLRAALALEGVVWTASAMNYRMLGNYRVLRGKPNPEYWKRWKNHALALDSLYKRHEASHPELFKKSREEVAKSLSILDGEPSDGSKKKLPNIWSRSEELVDKHFYESFGFQANTHWYSYVGWTWPTPVCDGTWLYVFMCQGQVAKLSLKDGSIAWQRRINEGSVVYMKQPTPRSPILHQGIFYVAAPDALYALEAETGKEIWKWKPSDDRNYSDPVGAVGVAIVTLPNGRKILANGAGNHDGGAHNALTLFDAKTGEVLFESGVKFEGKSEPGASLMSKGDLLFFGNAGYTYRIKEQDGKVVPELIWKFRRWDSNVQVLHEGLYYSNHNRGFNVYDVSTGKTLLPVGLKDFRLSTYRPGIMVGDRLVGNYQPKSPKSKIEGLYRFTQHFKIIAKDGSMISDDTVLEFTSPEADNVGGIPVPQAASFLENGGKASTISSICCGVPPLFGWGGMYAQGKYLLIPSTKYLYCIAPALEGLATDDPAVIAKIDKASDASALREYLESPSAKYRHSAVKRLGQIDSSSVAEVLKKLAVNDPYFPIRADAVKALGDDGYALVRAQIRKRFGSRSFDKHYAKSLTAFGEELDPIIIPMLTDNAQKQVREAALRAIKGTSGGPALRDRLLAIAKGGEGRGLATMALSDWPKDEKISSFFKSTIGNKTYGGPVSLSVLSYFERVMEPRELATILMRFIEKDIDHRGRVFDLLSSVPAPDGLFDVLLAAAKRGSQGALWRLPGASGGDQVKYEAAVKEILTIRAMIPQVVRMCLETNILELEALDAVLQELNRKDVNRPENLVGALGTAHRSKNPAVIAKAVQSLAGLLSNEKLRFRATLCLKEFGAHGEPALKALKAIDTSSDGRLKNKVNDAIRAIEKELAKKKKQ